LRRKAQRRVSCVRVCPVDRDETPQGRVLIALELYALAEAQLRARLSRTRPALSRAEISRRVRAWQEKRPSAGDSIGKAVPWPRVKTRSKRPSAKQ
jgi:hypothetical protein